MYQVLKNNSQLVADGLNWKTARLLMDTLCRETGNYIYSVERKGN